MMNNPAQRPPWIRITKRVLPLAILLILAILLQVYERSFSALLYAKSLVRKTPELWNVPKPLELDPTVPAGGKIFCRFGFQFNSPWTDVASERNLNTVEVLIFSSGQGLAIYDESKTLDASGSKALFGYAFRSSALNTTPADLHWFSSKQRMARSSTFIAMKSLDAPDMKGGIYSFETPWFRGFQIGSPSRDEKITVEMFDPQDLKFRLLISSKPAPSGKLVQSDINQIISTLQPASADCD
jgi:hypothetical protein